MQIQFEKPDHYAIHSYDDSRISCNGMVYQQNCIVSKQGILTDWCIESIRELQGDCLKPLLERKPEIIIIGHRDPVSTIPNETREFLMKHRIGFETMSIGAACRTYNVLLSEYREVILGIIFSSNNDSRST